MVDSRARGFQNLLRCIRQFERLPWCTSSGLRPRSFKSKSTKSSPVQMSSRTSTWFEGHEQQLRKCAFLRVFSCTVTSALVNPNTHSCTNNLQFNDADKCFCCQVAFPGSFWLKHNDPIQSGKCFLRNNIVSGRLGIHGYRRNPIVNTVNSLQRRPGCCSTYVRHAEN